MLRKSIAATIIVCVQHRCWLNATTVVALLSSTHTAEAESAMQTALRSNSLHGLRVGTFGSWQVHQHVGQPGLPAPAAAVAPICISRRWQPSPQQHLQQQQRHVSAQAFQFKEGPDASDRVLAALPYLLPLLDALPYGRYIFLDYPYVARAMAPLAPLAMLYNGIPFAPILLFLAVYSFIVNNQSLNRFIRINAMQAVLLDILLIIPQVLMDDVLHPPAGGPMLSLYVSGTNTIFLFVAVCVAYGMGASAVGQTPRLPLVAKAADMQIRDGPSGF